MRERCSIACIIPPVLLEELARRAQRRGARRAAAHALARRQPAPRPRPQLADRRAPSTRATIRQSVTAGPAAAHDLRLPRARAAERPRAGAGRGRPADRRRHRQRGLRRARRHLRVLLGPVQPRLDRRPGHAAARLGPLRLRVRQRVLGRRADGVRRRQDVRPLHQVARRDRPRAHPRRDRARGGPAVPQPVRRAQRVGLRRLRQPRQAVQARPGRRPGRLADRRRPRQARLPGQGAALDGRARHRLGRRQPARAHGRLRADDERQRRRAHQLGHPEQGLRRARRWRWAGRRGRRPGASGTRRCATRRCARTRPSASSPGAPRRPRGSSTAPAATRSTPSPPPGTASGSARSDGAGADRVRAQRGLREHPAARGGRGRRARAAGARGARRAARARAGRGGGARGRARPLPVRRHRGGGRAPATTCDSASARSTRRCAP